MLIKSCYEPVELKVLRCLNTRMNLSVNEKQYYINLDKGYEGERNFEILLEKHPSESLILNDLLLEKNNTVFQIDTMLISQKNIYLFEVKNYEGDFYIDKDMWYSTSGIEIKNPLHQLKRSESLLRRLLQDFGSTFSIEAYLIFINPEFTLYQVPLNLPIIFPSQLNRFMKKLNMTSSKLNGKHSKLAEQLVSAHINESPFTRLPNYDYEQLQKGITCVSCNSFMISFNEKNLVCNGCGCKEDIESAVMRSAEEFKLLFPERKITTNAIHAWCKVIDSKKTIRRILMKNFKLMFQGKLSYYVLPEEKHN